MLTRCRDRGLTSRPPSRAQAESSRSASRRRGRVATCSSGRSVAVLGRGQDGRAGVSEDAAPRLGAVSPECRPRNGGGARERRHATSRVSVTGIAGPAAAPREARRPRLPPRRSGRSERWRPISPTGRPRERPGLVRDRDGIALVRNCPELCQTRHGDRVGSPNRRSRAVRRWWHRPSLAASTGTPVFEHRRHRAQARRGSMERAASPRYGRRPDRTSFGKGSVMRLGDAAQVAVGAISTGSLCARPRARRRRRPARARRRDLRPGVLGQDDARASRHRQGAEGGRDRARSSTPSTRWTRPTPRPRRQHRRPARLAARHRRAGARDLRDAGALERARHR